MAIAPVNKFLTVAVPVAPGEQKIDGRLVLEKTATVFDRLYITGTQTGIVTITDVTYDEPTGVSTITTLTAHGFDSGSEITMSGIAMTCPSGSGITTTIFPSPQKSYIVDNIESDVGGSKTFTTTVGSANGITHTYVSGGLVGPLQMEFIGSFLENSTT
jgi:subtilisin family serine protease